MAVNTHNRVESRVAGVTLQGRPHPSSALFIVLLRIVMGGMMLFAGLSKYAAVPGGESFDAYGFLANSDAPGLVGGLYGAMAANATLIEVVNVIIPLTQVLIGIALLTGGLVRLAAFGGALQMIAFYLGGWDGQWLAAFDSTLVYAVVFLALGALAAGRILGADGSIERVEIGGKPLIERYPKMLYVLG